MFKFFGITLLLFSAIAWSDDPRFHREFPPREPGQLSPPVVAAPIHECAEIVHVYGFIPHAKIEVIANGSESVGHDQPVFGFADIHLTRPLKFGEKITATQTVLGMTSVQSYVPVPVTHYPSIPGGLNQPVVGTDIYACGRIVPVDKLVPSVNVHVLYSDNNQEIGMNSTAGTWQPVWTDSLISGKPVTAQQIACEDQPDKTLKSPMAIPMPVKADPNPIPKPTVGNLVVGNDAIGLYGLFVGAEIEIKDTGNPVGGGFATASSNWAHISQPVAVNSDIRATQKLCAAPSLPSDPVKPDTELTAPQVLDPICEGNQFAVIRNSKVNANILLFRNSSISYGGAGPGDVLVGLGGGAKFAGGDKVKARQSMGPSTLSPDSNVVTVVGGLRTPAIEILGGEYFFVPEQGEQAIDGPVFPRGKGAGPIINIQACCTQNVKAKVHDVNGAAIASLMLTEVFPGYFTSQWNWTSTSGWTVPGGIPIGPYSVRVTTECNQEPASKTFYVIFNPADVGGPNRFSFDETGVWFGSPPKNQSTALVYYLHPDDNRVFQKAINAAKGEIDPKNAAIKVSDAEESLFAYSLSYHTNDVISMLTNFTEAQCADDANVLTSMLRSIGIPSHPATGDADLETGPGTWTFDTWTEFLVPNNGPPEWLILHPHELPNDPPRSRSNFGANVGVATKSFNDLVMMAEENWIWQEVTDNNPDVTYNRSNCTEPLQNHVSHSAWLKDLCEGLYWNPNHWDCVGISSSGLSIDWSSETQEFDFGTSLVGTLTISSTDRKPFGSELTIEVVSDLPESKVFPDRVILTRKEFAKSDKDYRATVPLRMELPRNLEPGHDLYLVVRTKDKIEAVKPLTFRSLMDVSGEILGKPTVGGEIDVSVTITSKSRTVLEGLKIETFVPPGVSLSYEKDLPRTLNPQETRKINWKARISAPLEAGAIKIRVSAANDGWVELILPIRILGFEAPPDSVLQRKKQ